ncbi:MAG: DUF2188 domain-containing protein [Deltaproteobacteria bacterium]|nr:DUF2188 domain-containing protein [Deltaproteobacteria bacterium]
MTPRTGGGWNVREENASSGSSSYDTKAEAKARAKELAKKQALGQVIIHKRYGTIQTEPSTGRIRMRSKDNRDVPDEVSFFEAS